jgi:hypothetical protein
MIPITAGRVVFIEFKREGGHTTPLQEDCHRYLRSLGHEVLLTSDEHEAFNLVKTRLEEIPPVGHPLYPE